MPIRSTGLVQDASTGDAFKDKLVQQVKSFQRQGQTQKDLWHTWCDTRLGGVRDPFRHEATALQEFVAANGLPPPAGGDAAKGRWVAPAALAAAAIGYDPAKETLVQQVKIYQRQGPTQTETWQKYADLHLGGSRDPARHDAAILRQFLEKHGAGGVNDPLKERLVQQVKTFQRQGEEQKDTWHEFADTHLQGIRDPARHDVATLRTFTQMWVAEPAVPQGIAQELPDPLKDLLVQQVKAYQRQGQEQKDSWHSYADLQLGGVRDPARHDPSVLQDFITAHDVPVLPEPASKRMKDSNGAPVSMSVEDPMKHELVLQVKAYQRTSQQQKDAWHQYADIHLAGIRDPARHDAHTLQEFIVTHGVPPISGLNFVTPSDSRKEQLVAQVKAFQSQGQQQKDMWHNYADTQLGGTRDPARHDPAKLQEFFDCLLT